MKKLLCTLFISSCLCAAGAYYYLWGPEGIYTPSHRQNDQTIIIEKGMGMAQMGRLLAKQGIIDNEYLFYAATYIENHWGKLKAGEFLIPQKASLADIVNLLASGKVIVHQVTFPEGITVRDILEKIDNIPQLKGNIVEVVSEGELLPETYSYVYGDTKQSLINQMRQNMTHCLETSWKGKKGNLPYQNKSEALVMASIIEKETAKHHERPQVAAVFINRLKFGMKLQADPTVIYGLTLGQSKFQRSLTKDDLQSPTPYNTYVIHGLPPKPIACPGKASIQAALNPAETNDLYFVADGNGGHNFSQNLTQHNTYVKQWRSQGSK